MNPGINYQPQAFRQIFINNNIAQHILTGLPGGLATGLPGGLATLKKGLHLPSMMLVTTRMVAAPNMHFPKKHQL